MVTSVPKRVFLLGNGPFRNAAAGPAAQVQARTRRHGARGGGGARPGRGRVQQQQRQQQPRLGRRAGQRRHGRLRGAAGHPAQLHIPVHRRPLRHHQQRLLSPGADVPAVVLVRRQRPADDESQAEPGQGAGVQPPTTCPPARCCSPAARSATPAGSATAPRRHDQPDADQRQPAGHVRLAGLPGPPLPVIWQPDGVYSLTEVAGNLRGVSPQSPTLSINPEDWYFVE